MAKIVVAEHAGACFGVERALGKVEEVVKASRSAVHTLGPLIHNPSVVASLEDRGVSVIDDAGLDKLPEGDMVVLRTHGVVPDVVERAESAGLEVVDATCPYVKKVHRAAERLAERGYQVLVVGESGHPEVEGILGHAPDAHVVLEPEDLDGLDLGKRVGVVVQTTQSKANLDAVMSHLTELAEEVCLVNTVCAATSERQAAASELSQEADVMVVIGGRNSANTTRLAEICAAHGPVHHIESVEELDPAWFTGAGTIGVTAGASTPAAQIDAVVDAIGAMTRNEGDCQ